MGWKESLVHRRKLLIGVALVVVLSLYMLTVLVPESDEATNEYRVTNISSNLDNRGIRGTLNVTSGQEVWFHVNIDSLYNIIERQNVSVNLTTPNFVLSRTIDFATELDVDEVYLKMDGETLRKESPDKYNEKIEDVKHYRFNVPSGKSMEFYVNGTVTGEENTRDILLSVRQENRMIYDVDTSDMARLEADVR